MDFRASTPKASIDKFVDACHTAGVVAPTRAIQRALNGVALQARRNIIEELDTVFDKPSRFTMNAIVAKLNKPPSKEGRKDALLNVDELTSEVRVKDLQSAYFKYALGDNDREPGDVGPADQHIYVPFWDVIGSETAKKNGVSFKKLETGGMPRAALKKLVAKTKKGKGRAPTRRGIKYPDTQGIWFGRLSHSPSSPLGFWLRPHRIRKGEPKANGEPRVINGGEPRLLVGAFDRAEYDDILTPAWERASERAMATLPEQLEQQYAAQMASEGR